MPLFGKATPAETPEGSHAYREIKNKEISYKRARRDRFRRLLTMTVFVLVIGGLAAGLRFGYWYLTTAPRFATNIVTITGNRHASSDQLLDLVGGPRPGNVFTLDLPAIQARLLEHSWVKEASVSRVMPGTLEVRIVERTPVAVAVTAKGPWLVDSEGVRVSPYGAEHAEFDLPFISGLKGGPEDELLALGLRALASIGVAEPATVARLSEIDCSHESVRLIFLDGTPALIVGSEKFVERMEFYQRIAPSLRDRFARIDYVDLRFTPRVYIKGDFLKTTTQEPVEAAAGAV
ncbi:MAG: FtsQ-type POTRA domain-containing protein [Acidobacteriota bacterium]